MSRRGCAGWKAWLAGLAVALAVASTGIRCARDVRLGVDPGTDAASNDAGTDTRDGP